MVKRLAFIVALFLLSGAGYAQSLVSYVTLNPKDAYIGEPVELTVSVFSSTWFTSGIDLGNIKVDGALTVFFRSVSTSETFNGERHAGVDFYYNVFPTKEGTLTIPSLSIDVESPKPGDFKGKKHTLSTKPKSITVKGIPFGYDPNEWLVARSLKVTEQWSQILDDVKVGDVIQRTISRSAGGTLSEFIPATFLDTIPGVSLYPKRAAVSTSKSKTGVSSYRSETVNYLFEEEGQLLVPSVYYVYWNSRTKRFYKKQLDSVTVNVQANADLEMLASIKRSLQEEEMGTMESAEESFAIFGLDPKVFLKYLFILILGLYVLQRVLSRAVEYFRKVRADYLQSERYAFNQVKKSLKHKDVVQFYSSCNSWLVKLGAGIGLDGFLQVHGSEKLNTSLGMINEATYKHRKTGDKSSFETLLSEMKKARDRYQGLYKRKDSSEQKESRWLNPTVGD